MGCVALKSWSKYTTFRVQFLVGAVLEAVWRLLLKNRNIGIKPHAIFKIFDRFNAPSILPVSLKLFFRGKNMSK